MPTRIHRTWALVGSEGIIVTPMTPPELSEHRTDRALAARTRARAHWNVAIGILGINGALYLTLILLIA